MSILKFSCQKGQNRQKNSGSNPASVGAFKLPSGEITSSKEAALAYLLDTHFPGNEAVNIAHMASRDRSRSREDRGFVDHVITTAKVQWSLKQFCPYKSGGDDGIFPALLQKALPIVTPIILGIYRACLRFGYVPMPWRLAKVVFIPKPGKPSYAVPKAFRPISLTSFMLKGLERILDRYVRDEVLVVNKLHDGQHAYTNGRSTETALHSLVTKAEGAVLNRKFCLSVFFDIEGAFDKASVEVIFRALKKAGVHSLVSEWIRSVLQNRTVIASLGDSSVKRVVRRGCPQGGVLSPLLWCLVVDDLLKLLDKGHINSYVQFYADDGTIMVTGTSLGSICKTMQRLLHSVESWCRRSKLDVNPVKTEVVLFTRKRTRVGYVPLTLNGQQLLLSEKVKYLGVYLDSKLSWAVHVQEKLKQATVALFQLKSAVGVTWGLKPQVMKWLYTAVVRPVILYGSVVWWERADKGVGRTVLDRFQRLALRLTSSCFATTPTRAIEVILDVPPLHVAVIGQAVAASVRLIRCGFTVCGSGHNGIAAIAKDHKVYCMREDFCLKRYVFEQNYQVFPVTGVQQELVEAGTLHCYTDGSRFQDPDRTGFGVFIEELDCRIAKPLGRFATVFQTEVMAILEAASFLSERRLEDRSIVIHSDSQAALKSLDTCCIRSHLVDECKRKLNALGSTNRLLLTWVKGHVGILGNEEADALARTGSDTVYVGPEPAIGLSVSVNKKVISDAVCASHQRIWETSASCRHAKEIGINRCEKLAREVLARDRKDVRALLCLLTGHGGFRKQLHRMGLAEDSICPLCRQEEDTALHLLCECQPLRWCRFSCLGQTVITDPSDISGISISSLLGFLRKSGRFEEITGSNL